MKDIQSINTRYVNIHMTLRSGDKSSSSGGWNRDM
jgi:hypothetical protein